MTKVNLEPAKQVIRSFLSEMETAHGLQSSTSVSAMANAFSMKDRTPILGTTALPSTPNSYSIKETAYMWLYAEARHFRRFMHRPKANTIPPYYQQPALPIYQDWLDEEKDVIYRGCIIPQPHHEMNLTVYLQQLALIASEENEHRAIWIKSLRSFLAFVREDAYLDLQGALEVIFPYKMEFRKGHTLKRSGETIKKVECRYILRRVDDVVAPIDILTASEIIKNLARAFLAGRPNLQHSAAEALGFAWLCHAVGSYRLVTREEIVFLTPTSTFKSCDLTKSEQLFRAQYHIGVESLFGIIDTPISKTLHDFLVALPRDPGSDRIFSLPWRTLYRTFYKKGVQLFERARNLGRITFLTFMSQPHEVIEHRPLVTKTTTSTRS